MLRNLGGAIGTAVLATVITKREQFHSHIIGQSVNLGREEVRNRIARPRIISCPQRLRPPPRIAGDCSPSQAVKHQAL